MSVSTDYITDKDSNSGQEDPITLYALFSKNCLGMDFLLQTCTPIQDMYILRVSINQFATTSAKKYCKRIASDINL